jgi:Cu-processing system permease protein
MNSFSSLLFLFLSGLKRDKVLWSLGVVSLLFVVSIPIFSLFSMRQVQELAVTLSLSGTSLFLLVCTVFLGATSIWRDLEKRFAVAVLALPLPRYRFVFAKFATLGLFLMLSLVVLGALSAFGATLAAAQYAPARPLDWVNFTLAFGMLGLKYLLLLALTLALSALSTSFFLPVFGALGLFLAGSASFQVVEFLLHNPERFSPLFIQVVQVLHYLLPNFAAFDYQVFAIYGLPVVWSEVVMSVLYGLIYIVFALVLAAALFNRREI